MTKQRLIRSVKLYFEPLTWLISPVKHRIGFYFMWITLTLFVAFNYYHWSTK
jgi:hypothetical protein